MSRTKRSGYYLECGDTEPTRDKKKWYKPDSKFKKMKSRLRKAKIKDCLRKGRELPIEKKTDVWDYN